MFPMYLFWFLTGRYMTNVLMVVLGEGQMLYLLLSMKGISYLENVRDVYVS